MGAEDMRVVSAVTPEAPIGVLAAYKPRDKFIEFLWRELMLEGGEAGERPVSPCHFQVLGEVLSDGVEILAVLERQHVFEVLLPEEGKAR
jgi:hypothetical protein